MCLLKPGYCQYASFIINLVVYIILWTPFSRVFLEKLTGSQIDKKSSAFYGTRMFITAFTRAATSPTLCQFNPVHAPPLPTSLRSIVISSHLHLGLPTGLLPSGLPTKILYDPRLSPIRATRPTHFYFLDLINQIIFSEQYRSWSSSLRSLLHFAVTSSLLGPNILLCNLFLNPLSLYSPPPQCYRLNFTPLQNQQAKLYFWIFSLLNAEVNLTAIFWHY